MAAFACAQAAASARVYLDQGSALHVHTERGTWAKSGNYYQSASSNATLSMGDVITTGDFKFVASLKSDRFDINPGVVLINQLGEFGLTRSGGNTPAFVRGFFFGDITRELGHRNNFLQDDASDFNLEVSRVGDVARLIVNGHTVWRTTFEGNRTFGKIGFKTAPGGLKIKSAILESGNWAPIAEWVNPRTEIHAQPGEQVDVFSRGSGEYHTYRIPALEKTRSGVLLAFCEGRRHSGSDRGSIDLLVKRSLDNGATWSAPIVVHSEPGDITIGNPVPIHDHARNRTFLIFCRNNDRVFITVSRDDGQTWDAPREITSEVKQPTWNWFATGPGHGLLTSAGRMIVPANHGSKAHTIYSDDYGKTWHIGGIMPGYGNEVTAAETSDKRLLLNSRNTTTAFRRRMAYSNDGGLTWGDPAERHDLIEPTCQGSLENIWLPASEKMILFSNPASVRRERLTVRFSDNDGTTWSAGRIIYSGSSAYSDLCDLGDGWVGCLYERDWYDHLTFARFHVSWLRDSRVENWKDEEVATD